MDRFAVQEWVCDYGIWDIDNRKFVGKPIESFRDANIICAWFNTVDFDRLAISTDTLGKEVPNE